METSKFDPRIRAALRADRPYRGEVDRASAILTIIGASPVGDRIPLMAQVLADYGLPLGPETPEAEAPPFTALDPDQIRGIDARLRERVAAFVQPFRASDLPIEEVANRVLIFLADFLPNDRIVAFGRMLREGIAPYAQIPAGWIPADAPTADTRLRAAEASEAVLRAGVLIERISRQPGITAGQVFSAFGQVARRHLERPDEFAGVLFRIGVECLAREAEETPTLAAVMVRGDLATALASVLGAGIQTAPADTLEAHARSCQRPDCGIKRELARRAATGEAK